ncbi:hypothetical protein NPIL_333021, partial [Nephila pilipes]
MSDSDWSDTIPSISSIEDTDGSFSLSEDDSDETFDIENDTDKRQYHNQLKRKRRYNLNDTFNALRAITPSLRESNVKVSRYQVLREFIKFEKETEALRKLDKEKEEKVKQFEEYMDEYNASYDKYTAEGDTEKIKELVYKSPSEFGLDSDEFNALSDDGTDSESNLETDSEADNPPAKR